MTENPGAIIKTLKSRELAPSHINVITFIFLVPFLFWYFYFKSSKLLFF